MALTAPQPHGFTAAEWLRSSSGFLWHKGDPNSESGKAGKQMS